MTAPKPVSRHRPGLIRRSGAILRAAMVLLIGVLLLGQALYAPFNHNEEMYLTASVLLSEHVLYDDFAFLQMPYLPYLYRAVYQITGTSEYLLWGRLTTLAAMLVACALLWRIAFNLTRNRALAWTALVLFASNNVVLEGLGEASNYVMPVAFHLAGLHLFLLGLPAGHPKRLILSGFFLALAVGTRLTYAFLVPPFYAVLLLYACAATGRRDRIRRSLFLTGGLVLGLLPVAYFFGADPQTFLFNNLGYHAHNADWRELTGYTEGMTASGKLLHTVRLVRYPTIALLAFGFLYSLLIGGIYTVRPNGVRDTWSLVTPAHVCVALLVTFSIPAVFAPTPIWNQYYVLAMPFLTLVLATISSIFARASPRLVDILSGLAAASLLIALAQVGWGAASAGQTTPSRVDQVAQAVRAALEGRQGKIATTSPLHALEAGLPVYREFSTGVFAYRIGDLLTGQERARFVTTSPATLHALLDADPPAAIFVRGIYSAALDGPFIDYALSRGYTPAQGDFDGGRLFVAPFP